MSVEVQRAAGAALRSVRRPGTPLKPQQAIDAIAAAAGALFGLEPKAVDRMLRPALADWRDAVGCADPLLLPANAAAERALVPLPMPSWCAWLIEAGALRLDGPAAVDGPRVVQPAHLMVVREAQLSAVESFPLLFAGRYGAASLEVHLALSPPFAVEPGSGWRGTICLRAAAQRTAKAAPLWLGAPAHPSRPPPGTRGEGVVTWTGQAAPRWAVLRLLEGREPQALWDLDALWRAKELPPPARARASEAGRMRLAIDIGSTSTVVVEEDSATAGSIGGKLLGPRVPPSGFRLLAGNPATAGRVGCAEQLLAPGGQLPTVLAAPSAQKLSDVLRGEAAPEELWLLQSAETAGVIADRFKSPELLLLSEWLAAPPVAGEAGADRGDVSRKLLDAYGYLLGRTLAAAHAAPLVTAEGGGWTLRAPRLASAEAVLTCPQTPFDSAAREPFARVLGSAAERLCDGLVSAWESASSRLAADPAAAEAAREPGERSPEIEVFADFGGLTLQITVRLPQAAGRPGPLVRASSMSYLLGGERLIDSAAFASAGRQASGVREAYRQAARRWRSLIASGGHLAEPATVAAARDAILGTVVALVRRQLIGTLRRANGGGLRGLGVRLFLLGEGWKLVALDVPDAERETQMLMRVTRWLDDQPLLEHAPLKLQRMTKRRVCEGALRVHGEAAAAEAAELQGVDVASASGARRRWFGLVQPGALAGPDLAPDPRDPWWREFGGADGALVRVDQWFAADSSPFAARLSGGNLMFDPDRSFLKQWLDVCGPSLVALRVHERL